MSELRDPPASGTLAAVEITIVKAQTGPDRAVVDRPATEAVQFAVHDHGPALPHDLVHYVVEDELRLEFGFWGLMSAGAKLQSVQAYDARDHRHIPPPYDPTSTTCWPPKSSSPSLPHCREPKRNRTSNPAGSNGPGSG